MQQIILKINIFDDTIKGTERATVAAKTDNKIEEEAKSLASASVNDSQRNTVYESAPGDEINSNQAVGIGDKKQELVKIEKEIATFKKQLADIKAEHSKDSKNGSQAYKWKTSDDEQPSKGGPFGVVHLLMTFIVFSFLGSYFSR